MIYIWRRFINLFEFFYLFVFLFVLLPVKHKQFNCQKQQGQLMSSFQYVTEIPHTGDITITFDFFWQKTQMLRLFTRLSEEVMLKMEPTVSYRSSGLRAALNQGPLALPSSHSAWMTGDMNVQLRIYILYWWLCPLQQIVDSQIKWKVQQLTCIYCGCGCIWTLFKKAT
jgi:hypothetical protein